MAAISFFCSVFLPKNGNAHAANARGTSSSRCKLVPRPVGQRDSFSHESDAPQPFSLTLFHPPVLHNLLRIISEVDQRAGREPCFPKRYFQKLTSKTLIPNP